MGECLLNLTIGEIDYELPVIVSDAVENIVIGLGFMMSQNLIWRFGAPYMELDDQLISLEGRNGVVHCRAMMIQSPPSAVQRSQLSPPRQSVAVTKLGEGVRSLEAVTMGYESEARASKTTTPGQCTSPEGDLPATEPEHTHLKERRGRRRRCRGKRGHRSTLLKDTEEKSCVKLSTNGSFGLFVELIYFVLVSIDCRSRVRDTSNDRDWRDTEAITPTMDEDALVCVESDASAEEADAEVTEINQDGATPNGSVSGQSSPILPSLSPVLFLVTDAEEEPVVEAAAVADAPDAAAPGNAVVGQQITDWRVQLSGLMWLFLQYFQGRGNPADTSGDLSNLMGLVQNHLRQFPVPAVVCLGLQTSAVAPTAEKMMMDWRRQTRNVMPPMSRNDAVTRFTLRPWCSTHWSL